MDVNDKREQADFIEFSELKIGDVYEDRDGIICIKTHEDDIGHNCICFIGREWEANLESLDAEVRPLKTCLEIER